ncbi:MAG: hypothetical protein ACRDN0_20025 [Trebonia sp.]
MRASSPLASGSPGSSPVSTWVRATARSHGSRRMRSSPALAVRRVRLALLERPELPHPQESGTGHRMPARDLDGFVEVGDLFLRLRERPSVTMAWESLTRTVLALAGGSSSLP